VNEAKDTRAGTEDGAGTGFRSERYELEDFFGGASPWVSGFLRLLGIAAVLTALWLVLRWPLQWL
jgi:hypothetical protein